MDKRRGVSRWCLLTDTAELVDKRWQARCGSLQGNAPAVTPVSVPIIAGGIQ